MSENYYECMFVLDSGKFAADPNGVTEHTLDILQKSGAQVDAHRPWQDGKLAYPIENHRKGVHYLALFRMDGTKLNDVARAVKLSDVVLRHLVIKHPQVLFDQMIGMLSGDFESVTDTEASSAKADDTDDSESDDEDSED